MKKKLCAIGEALIDFIPEQKGSYLKDVIVFQTAVGGAPANVAGAVAKLGGCAKFITKLGNDAFGDRIVSYLQCIGVDTSAIQRTQEGDTSLAFVSLTNQGERDFQFYRRFCADQLLCGNDVHASMLEDCGILHFCSVALSSKDMQEAHEKLLLEAKKQNICISFDPNIRLALWPDEKQLKEVIWKFISYADILKISDDELLFVTGTAKIEEALPILFAQSIKLVLYTKGKEGAIAYWNDQMVEEKGRKVDVIDTTGAGDSFIGAFLYCLLRDDVFDICDIQKETMKNYLTFANGYAAYTTTKKGAMEAMATKAQYDAFLKSL